MDNSPHTQVDNNVIKIALLENNQVIFERIDKAVENNGAKITKVVNDKTDSLISQITSLATVQGSNVARITDIELKLSNIWAKIVALQSVIGFIIGLIGFLIGGGHLGSK
ncbi:hypothetical protein [Cryobacterium sp. GrIS_2_6]|uniref:hypothetical protein n=1 Tax=Cryobacterium sp. GrIS_2_6 TaxID=3162785 RepID=UPI002E002CD1|nr:hypothetical protein [Cryobacterium psychrotolerans]